MSQAAALLNEAAQVLERAGLESPRREARLILAHCLNISPGVLALEESQDVRLADETRFRELVGRRSAREPFAYLTGERGFWTLDLEVSPAVLIPRPETEVLVEAAVKAAGAGQIDIVDFGTGSGAILIALLSELPHATGLGVDVSQAALEVAKRNAVRNGVGARARFGRSSWWSHVRGAFDLIVSNPPYIETAAIAGLEPEVRSFEPHLALDGGVDGLGPYRAIATVARQHLNPGGAVVVEVGQGQAEQVGAIFAHGGLEKLTITPDLSGIARVVTAAI